MKRYGLILSLLLVSLLTMQCTSGEKAAAGTARAVFAVSWFDVGKAALAGRPGIISVENGWRGSNEVNRVVFDPGLTSVEKMEKRLIRSGTYIRTISEPEQEGPGKKTMEKQE